MQILLLFLINRANFEEFMKLFTELLLMQMQLHLCYIYFTVVCEREREREGETCEHQISIF